MNDFKAGDLMAFNLLYARHKGSTYRYILRQCNEQHLADDLMQELWSKLIKAKNNYEPSAKFTTWLYRIAHHVIVDNYRQSTNYHQTQDDDYNVESLPDIQSETLEKMVENKEQHKHIKYCMGKLPNNLLEMFLLKQETDLTINQIADIVECSFEAAKSRLRYAYKSLRQCLSKSLIRGE